MTRPLRLLLIDENPSDREQAAQALRAAFDKLEVVEAGTSEAFARALEAARYDAAILERRTTWSDGIKLGGLLRERYPDCPLLMFSLDDRLQAAVEAMKSGFDEYLPKTPGRYGKLPKTVETLIDQGRLRKREAWIETRLQELLGRLNVGVYRATSRGIILYANSAFCRIFGISSWREAPTWSLRSMMADPSEEARLARELKRTGFLQNVELKLKGAGGRELWISLTQSVRSGVDSLEVIEGLVEDITERKRQSLVSRRRDEEIHHQQKLETVGRLAGGVAHDFNNMLTAINGYSELLLENIPEDHPLRDNVLEIKKAGSRAAMLTRQLLAFSSRLMLFPRRVDLNTFIQDLEGPIREALGNNIRYQCIPASDPGPVYADSAQLEHVLMSMVVNSRDSMPAGGTFTLRTGRVAVTGDGGMGSSIIPADRLRPGNYGLIIVEDTGIGMDEDTLARIFEPFFTTKPMGKGMGMGLSTAYGIMKQSGGAIQADSMPGRGTRMRLYLPTALPGQGVKAPATGDDSRPA